MKLVAWMSGAAAVGSLSLFLVACSSSVSAPSAPQAPVVRDVAGTTQLMSAQLSGPAPRVGKSHLAVDAVDDTDATVSDQLGAPKEARKSNASDGTRRGGHFGTTK